MHPHCITSEITNEWLRQLIRKLRDYARYWYDCCKGPGSSKPNRKNVYGRAKCGFCSNEITLIRDGVLKRITYLCASCQLFPKQHDIIERKRRESISNNILPTARIFFPIQGKHGLLNRLDPDGCHINSYDNSSNSNDSNKNNSLIHGSGDDKDYLLGILPVQDLSGWKCQHCTLENPSHLTICEICDTIRPTRNILDDNEACSYSTSSKGCFLGNHLKNGNCSKEYSVTERSLHAYSDNACHFINPVRNIREEGGSSGSSVINDRLIRGEISVNRYPNTSYHNDYRITCDFNNNDKKNNNSNDNNNNNNNNNCSNTKYICMSNTSTYSSTDSIYSTIEASSHTDAYIATSVDTNCITSINDVHNYNHYGGGEEKNYWHYNKENVNTDGNCKKYDNDHNRCGGNYKNDNNNNDGNDINNDNDNSNDNKSNNNNNNNNDNSINDNFNNNINNNNSNNDNNNNNSNNDNNNNNNNNNNLHRDSSFIQHTNITLDTVAAAPVVVNDDDISGSGHAFIIPLFCKCTKQCTLHRVRKSGPTNSRLFWSCTARKCDFFSWGDGTFPKCQHGSPTTVRRVLKIGPTNGKYFFCCSQEKKCDFFLWSSKHITQSQLLLKSKPLSQSLPVPLFQCPLPLSCSLITNHYPQNHENNIKSCTKRSSTNSNNENEKNVPVALKRFKYVTIPL